MGGDCGIYSVVVSGRTVTVNGTVYAEQQPYDYNVYFDVIAYDTLSTMILNDQNGSGGSKVTSLQKTVAQKGLH